MLGKHRSMVVWQLVMWGKVKSWDQQLTRQPTSASFSNLSFSDCRFRNLIFLVTEGSETLVLFHEGSKG